MDARSLTLNEALGSFVAGGVWLPDQDDGRHPCVKVINLVTAGDPRITLDTVLTRYLRSPPTPSSGPTSVMWSGCT